jgi:mannitol/fructose-specific phosphotransferase system IIA component (Ntr-type)
MTTPDASRSCISKLITVANISLALRASERDAVLAELIERIPEIAGREDARSRLLQALKEREDLHSTGIGDGIALPHARSALTGVVEKPVIVFGRHPTGIPYRAVDGQPARLFFLLVATTVSQHLQILARISRLLRDATLRQVLLSSDQPEKVLAVIRDAEARM